MLERIEKYVVDNQLVGPGERLLIGVSGGADSVALLLILHALSRRLSFTVTVAHLDHGFRGEESAKDSQFVHRLCQSLDVVCECGYISVPSLLEGKSASAQEMARQARFGFFKEIMERLSLGKLALGHHQDDQAETVLLRIIRGTGLNGLKGMRPLEYGLRGICIIRPFLDTPRHEIEKFLAEQGQDYRVDSSNLGVEYSRNLVRHRVMPELCHINEKAVMAINRLATQAAVDVAFLNECAAREIIEAMEHLGFGIGVKIERLRNVHKAIAMRMLADAYAQVLQEQHDLETIHLEDALALLDKQPGRKISLPSYVRVLRTREHLVFYLVRTEVREQFSLTLSVPGSYSLPGGSTLTAEIVEDYTEAFVLDSSYVAYLSFSESTLFVRNRRPHDAYIPLGGVGHKKLKKALSEAEIPLPWRDSWPIILAMGQIAWVPGLRIAARFRVRAGQPILKLTYQRGGN